MQMLASANYLELFYAITINFLMSLCIGIFFLTFCDRNFQIEMIAIIIVIVSLILAGFACPLPFIHNHETVHPSTTYVVYIDPW